MNIAILADDFVICKVTDTDGIDLSQDFTFCARTDEEISLVCPAAHVPGNATATEPGWRGFRICGVLDFNLIGILSAITGVLSEGGIGLFAVSTFNTDYIFVRAEQLNSAVALLSDCGYPIIGSQ